MTASVPPNSTAPLTAVPPNTVPPNTGPPNTGRPNTGAPRGATGPLPLTPGRIAALVIGVPVGLVLIASTSLSLLTPFAIGHYPVSYTAPAGTRSLTVESAGGQLSVGPAAGDRVTLHGTAHYSFIRSRLTEQATGGGTTVNYHCATLPSSDCGLDATLSVPATLPVSVSTGGGDATVAGISAPVTLRSGGGNLTASRVTGPLHMDTGGGDVQTDDVSSDTVTIHTAGGNIRATGLRSRAVTAMTSGGDIEIHFATVPRDVQVSTAGGNVTLVLPPGPAQYAVNAHSSGGDVSDGLTQNAAAPNEITATTAGGNIDLRQGQPG